MNYDGVMAGILTALHRIGVSAEKSKVCDITLHGRKISGSAQKISGGRLLHHGTLLFDTDLTVLHEVSGRSGRTYHSRAIPSNPAQMVNISQYWQGTMADFRKALRAAYPADLTEASLTEEQLRLAEQLATETELILNLASKEYSKAVEPWLPRTVRFLTCTFGEENAGKIMEKGTMCKMARGQMLRWMAENDITNPADIRNFNDLEYRFSPEHSSENNYVFIKGEKRDA